jgi:hypothetical protein
MSPVPITAAGCSAQIARFVATHCARSATTRDQVCVSPSITNWNTGGCEPAPSSASPAAHGSATRARQCTPQRGGVSRLLRTRRSTSPDRWARAALDLDASLSAVRRRPAARSTAP